MQKIEFMKFNLKATNLFMMERKERTLTKIEPKSARIPETSC